MYSERTAQQIDAEAKRVIETAYALAEKVLREHADGLRELAELLLEREVVFTEDVERIFGKRKKDMLREAKEAKATENNAVGKPGTEDSGVGGAGDSETKGPDDAAGTAAAAKTASATSGELGAAGKCAAETDADASRSEVR